MGRQCPSASQALSQEIFFCVAQCPLTVFCVSINALSPDESFSIRSREAFGPAAGDGGCMGIAFSSIAIIRICNTV